jgi:heme O synthase-like polyprenyltransferase
MSLGVFTAFVGLMVAPGHLTPLLELIAIVAIAFGAGAAGALNMWYDADVDAKMRRTAARPIPRGVISRMEALVFGLVIAGGAVAVICGVAFVGLAWQVHQSHGADRRIAHRLFGFSIFYLVALFLALPVSDAGDGSRSIVSSRANAVVDGSMQVVLLERAVLTAPSPANLRPGGV